MENLGSVGVNVEFPFKMVDCVLESFTADADWADVVSFGGALCFRFVAELDTPKPSPAIIAAVAAHPPRTWQMLPTHCFRSDLGFELNICQ